MREVACDRCGKVTRVHPSVRIVVCACSTQHIAPARAGLGDHLERLLSYVGGNQYKRWYHHITGKQCPCEKRKHWLNRLGGRIYAAMQMRSNR